MSVKLLIVLKPTGNNLKLPGEMQIKFWFDNLMLASSQNCTEM